MRKWKTANPLKINDRIRERAKLTQPKQKAKSIKKVDQDFEATMARAFPEHLRGSVSGCCDSMESGHGIAGE